MAETGGHDLKFMDIEFFDEITFLGTHFSSVSLSHMLGNIRR